MLPYMYIIKTTNSRGHCLMVTVVEEGRHHGGWPRPEARYDRPFLPWVMARLFVTPALCRRDHSPLFLIS